MLISNKFLAAHATAGGESDAIVATFSYAPAYTLKDPTLERAGRSGFKPKASPISSARVFAPEATATDQQLT
jgi:hypothetical protein